MKIKVTEDHIKKGYPNSVTSCPIALALKEIGCKYVYVSQAYFSHVKDGKEVRQALPQSAQEFITDYDNWESVAAFEFESMLE